jgi:hypothetical protein
MAEVIELLNMDPYTSITYPYYKVIPKLEHKNYDTDLLKTLRVYKEFVLKVLASNVY